MNASLWRQLVIAFGSDAADLRMFAHLVLRRDSEVDLTRAALLIAEAEYPGLDVAAYAERVEQMGADAACLIGASTEQPPVMAAVRMLYEEQGFRASESEGDPRGCYLNEVLDQRLGSPVALCIVLLEVLRYAGVQAQPVPFAGRFLVRIPGAGRMPPSERQMLTPALISPSEGRFLAHGDLTELYRRSTHSGEPLEIGQLSEAGKRDLLLALLGELRAAHQARGDARRLRTVLLQTSVLQPPGERVRPSADRPSSSSN